MVWVACSNGSEMPGCYITCLYYFGSDIEADQPTIRCVIQHCVTLSFKRFVYKVTSGPKDSFRGFMSSARYFSKCSKQIWYWPSLSKFAFLIRTSHFGADVVFLEISAFRVAQWRHARRPSLQRGFQNGGRSNCFGTELFAVTVRLKGKFTS